eukprot:TRINITY_DN2562_c2_g1_i1.p1 TRINITY_DN2562_c2_g1~~TRINITY_DN2562_c2_g1_i1.p1  ORF type:complete len:236 (+),score=38.82 TRINITY_DN2562_c2_g1_i1:74-709(+)
MLTGASRALLRNAKPMGRVAFHARRWASAEGGAPKVDPYEVFEGRIGPDSGDKEIKEVYRDLVKEYHPDSNPDADPKKITEINDAYKILIKEHIKGKVVNKWFARADGDEPPVPRSELHERVYKAAETKWEESTQLMLFKIKKKYGTIVFWFAKVLFVVVQYLRAYKILVAIFVLMAFVSVIKGQIAQRHLEEMKKRRARAELSSFYEKID